MNRREYPIWPGWETVRLIGRGSFGAVYEIERDNYGHKEKAALKVVTIPQSASDIDDLLNDGYDEKSISTRFEGYMQDIVREYSMMADMKGCANIVYCDDWKSIRHDDGVGWDILIKMELLTSLVKALGKEVSDEQVIRIGTDICSALAFCEKRNVLHRDIKPQNIFVAPDGTCKLGDFGIAKTAERTTSGTKTGTYKYMAPEVYNNQPYGGKADIYSLGLVLYWLLNERRTPFLPLPPEVPSASQEDEARGRRFRGETLPAPAHGNEELQRIVLKACAYDPKDRYRSAEEMLRDLEALSTPYAPRRSTPPAEPAIPQPGPIEPEKPELPYGGTAGAFGAAAARQEKRETEEENEGTNSVTVGAFDRKDEPSAPPPKRRKWPVVLGVVGGILALLLIAFFTIHIWRPATCTEPETCRICGKTRGEALGHRYTEATCLEDAVCTVCGDVSKGAIGHDWGEPEYTWSADNSSVTAKRVCKNDPTHVESENVKTSSEVTEAATGISKGKTTYTATFKNSAFGTKVKTVEGIPAALIASNAVDVIDAIEEYRQHNRTYSLSELIDLTESLDVADWTSKEIAAGNVVIQKYCGDWYTDLTATYYDSSGNVVYGDSFCFTNDVDLNTDGPSYSLWVSKEVYDLISTITSPHGTDYYWYLSEGSAGAISWRYDHFFAVEYVDGYATEEILPKAFYEAFD